MAIKVRMTMGEFALKFNISVNELAEMWAVPLTESLIITITAQAIEKVRICSQCSQVKPLDEFVGDVRKRGGRGYRCKECRRKQHRDYNKRRPKHATSDYQKQWHEDHPNYYHEWRQAHPGYYTVYAAAWRARLMQAPGKISNEEWKDILHRYGNKCLACGAKEDLSMDHIIPLSIGGTNRIDNVQPLCRSCNSIKGTRYADHRPDAYWADWT